MSFSYDSNPRTIDEDICFLTYTTEKTHQLILDNKERTPLFSGEIVGIGPRYCPSLEDKVVRFPDRSGTRSSWNRKDSILMSTMQPACPPACPMMHRLSWSGLYPA